MASVRKSKRNVTGEKALGSGHSGGVPTMGGAPSVTGGQTSNWAKVVSRGKGGSAAKNKRLHANSAQHQKASS